jgi:hypothetical protein
VTAITLLWRRIKSDHLTRVRRIKWQVEPGTDSNFEHAILGGRDDTVAIGSQVLLPHRSINQQGNDLILIETHASHRLSANYRQAGCSRGARPETYSTGTGGTSVIRRAPRLKVT